MTGEIPVHITINSVQKMLDPGYKGAALARAKAFEYAGNYNTFAELEQGLAEAVRKCSDDFDTILPFCGDGDGESKVEFYTEGVMRAGATRIEISYEESELTGMEGTKTRIYFDPKCPYAVFLTRRGSVNSNMVFREGARTSSTYNTPVMPFIISISTAKVKNSVSSSGGEMEIVYAMEIGGSVAQKNRFRITVTADDM